MAELQTHPTYEDLAAFSLGQIAPPNATAIEEHITHCQQCCETLLGFGEKDTFIGLLIDAQRVPDGSTINLNFEPGIQPPNGESRSDRDEDDIPPALLGHARYRVVGRIGRGGMGDVYRAEHRLMERTVALKVINRKLIDRPEAVDRFQREVRAAARLNHPNIVAAYDAEQAGGIHFLAMEFVEGTELSQIVRDRGPLPVAEAVDFTLQTLRGLAHAHEMGMVHRDIKPHNMMLDAHGNIKILDFGLAHFASESATSADSEVVDSADCSELRRQLTQLGTMMGTPDYVAPEQAIDARSADIRSDIYSLGCTLYFLLTGRPPFADGSALDKLRSHTERDPESVAVIRKDIPAALNEVLRRMMAKHPADRYQTPSEAAEALRPFANLAAHEREAEPLVDGSGRRSTRKRWLIAAGFLPFIAAAGVMLYLATDTGRVEIKSDADNPGAKIVLAKGGKEYATFDLQPGTTTQTIRAGEYDISLRGATGDIGMSVWSKRAGSNDWGEPDQYESEAVAVYRGGGMLIEVSKRSAPALGSTQSQNRFKVESAQDENDFNSQQRPDKYELVEVRRLEGHTGPVKSVAFSPDGSLAASASGWPTGDGTVRLWDVHTGKELRQFQGHEGLVRSVCFSHNGKWLLTGGDDKTVRIWDVATGELLKSMARHAGAVEEVAFSTDDRFAISASGEDQTVRSWDVASGEQVVRFARHYGYINGVAAIDHERAISVDTNRIARIWRLDTGDELGILEGPAKAISVAVSQDGDLALIGYEQNHIVLWDLKSLKMQQSYRSDNWTTEAVNLTSDRRFAVTGGNDVGVELFELATGRHCASTGPVHRAWTVALSPDGRFALSAGGSIWNGTNFEPNGDYGIRLWQLPQVSMVSAASDEMRQTLTVFITEGKQELNDEKLQSLLARHAPVLSEFDLAVSRALASMLIELPDAAHAKLLQEGYLRWSFKSLDVKRQASLETFMKQLLAQATELGFPPATAEMGPTLLEHADVGFAIASPPDSDGQILYWYLSPHHSRMPICFPVLLANVDPNEHEILGGRWLIEKVFRISEKPYSDALPSATE